MNSWSINNGLDGEVKASGGYPSRMDLARFAGVEFEPAPTPSAQNTELVGIAIKGRQRWFYPRQLPGICSSPAREERASIHPYAWVINQSLLASGTKDPILAERGQREIRLIDEVRNQHAERVVLIPWKVAWRPGEDISSELAKAGVNCD